MPQPLRTLKHIKSTAYGIDAWAERPGHMFAVMRIIAAASFADHWFGNILVGIAKDRKVDLADLYNGFESEAKKTTSFEATATALLETNMHETLRLIVKAYKTSMKLRHPFAYSRFGFTPDDIDFIMLINPRDELLSRARHEALDAKPPKTEEEKKAWFEEKEKRQLSSTRPSCAIVSANWNSFAFKLRMRHNTSLSFGN